MERWGSQASAGLGARGVFFTPERFAREQAERMESTRGRLLIAGCRAGSYLSKRVAARYRDLLREADSDADLLELEDIDSRFSDTETCVRLEAHVSGYDVFLFQALLDPVSGSSVSENYMALLIAARTFREHGANHVTAVLPYLAYARQDKPTKFRREPTTAKLMADLTVEAGIDRAVMWNPHCDQIRGFYGAIPVHVLEPLAVFRDEFGRFADRDDVIAVAPDVGASKLITHFGRALNLKCAVASKYRPTPQEVVISEIIGDLADKRIAVVLDDMISGAGTVEALIKKLVRDTDIEEVYLGASHNLCVGPARERLVELHEHHRLKEVVITNSIPQTQEFRLPFVKVVCLSDALSRTINRIHYNRSVSEVFSLPQ